MSAISKDPAECPEPAESRERIIPCRHKLACSLSAVRRCGVSDSITGGTYPSPRLQPSKARPFASGSVADRGAARAAAVASAAEYAGPRIDQNRLCRTPRRDAVQG